MTTKKNNVVKLGIAIVCVNILGIIAFTFQLNSPSYSILATSNDESTFIETIQEKVIDPLINE